MSMGNRTLGGFSAKRGQLVKHEQLCAGFSKKKTLLN